MDELAFSWHEAPPDPLPGPTLSHFQTEHRARLGRAYGQRPLCVWVGGSRDGAPPLASWLLYATPGDYLAPPRRRLTRALDLHVRGVHSPAIHPDLDAREREDVIAALLDAVAARLRRGRPVSTSISLDPVMSGDDRALWTRLAERAGFAAARSWTYLAHLPDSADELSAQVKRDRRQGARKAAKAGVVCEEVSSLEGLREYFPLREETTRRNQTAPIPWDHFAATWETLAGCGIYRVWLARRDGRAAAGQLAFTWNGYVYLTGVSVAQWAIDEKLSANDALQWHVLHAALDEGRKMVDFGGAQPHSEDPKLKAIDAFKVRWGTTLEESLTLSLPPGRLRPRAVRLAHRLLG